MFQPRWYDRSITARCSADSGAIASAISNRSSAALTSSGVDCSGAPAVSVEPTTLRNRALRRSSMIMLRATVNNHARAERSVSPMTSGCCQARSNVSCPTSSDWPAPPVRRHP